GGRGRGTLRRRLRQHLQGRCASSTLRRAVAALLVDDLALSVALSASGKLLLTDDSETKLSAWLSRHARVCWMEHADPSTIERALICTLSPPLNVDGAPDAGAMRAVRRRLRERARAQG